jgi:hypothetical protein
VEAAFILELLAGIFFVIAAVPLLRIGLSDPLVPNRYLLFAGFSLAQLTTIVLLVPMYIGYETDNSGFTDTTDQLMGSLEMLTIAIIWLAFFPPRFYRGWIERAAVRSAAAR